MVETNVGFLSFVCDMLSPSGRVLCCYFVVLFLACCPIPNMPHPSKLLSFKLGNIVTSATGLSTLLNIRNALILNIKDPKPGMWMLRISAEGPHTIRITGLSSLDFVHGFSSRYTLSLSDTSARPMKGLFVCLMTVNVKKLTPFLIKIKM